MTRHDPAVTAWLRDHFDKLTELMMPLLAEGQKRGEIDRGTPPHELARFFLHAF